MCEAVLVACLDETPMADEVLAALVGVLGAGVLSLAGIVAGYLLRRIHEVRDRIRDLEEMLHRLEPLVEELEAQAARPVKPRGGRGRAS